MIENEEDFFDTLKAYQEIETRREKGPLSAWVLTPAYNLGEQFPKERFQNVISWNESFGGHFRVIGQQHKWIHGPDQKQV